MHFFMFQTPNELNNNNQQVLFFPLYYILISIYIYIHILLKLNKSFFKNKPNGPS